MSTQINDGGPAFPQQSYHRPNGEFEWPQDGMSLRDYFASNEKLTEWDGTDSMLPTAATEALAGRPMPAGGWGAKTPEQWLEMHMWEADWRARLKYIRADAMLRARNGGQK